MATKCSAFSLLLSLAFLGCGSDDAAMRDETSGANDSGFGGSSSGVGSPGGSLAGGGGLPPEMELESTYRAPVVTGHYVWSANPDSGRVAVIDPETLVVRLAEAGLAPTELAALPGSDGDRAVVINSGSEDATLLSADEGSVRAELTLPVHAGANAWSVSPSGHWAIAWTDSLRVEDADPAEGFQDITVVDLSTGNEASFQLSVGYRPSRISFEAQEERASW